MNMDVSWLVSSGEDTDRGGGDFAEDGWQISELLAGTPLDLVEDDYIHDTQPPPYTA